MRQNAFWHFAGKSLNVLSFLLNDSCTPTTDPGIELMHVNGDCHCYREFHARHVTRRHGKGTCPVETQVAEEVAY